MNTKPKNPAFSSKKLVEAVFDAVATKRVQKTGYVRQVGGIYPSENDTVASHLHAVSTIALKLAYELKGVFKKLDISLDVEKVLRMAIFHDHGEGRSGDTGATSAAIFGVCKLHFLERDGLEKSLADWKVKSTALKDYDEYREYSSSESLLVHTADILEGLEKGLHAHFNKPWVLEEMLFPILKENVEIFRNKHRTYPQLREVAEYLVEEVMIPGTQELFDSYRVEVNVRQLVT